MCLCLTQKDRDLLRQVNALLRRVAEIGEQRSAAFLRMKQQLDDSYISRRNRGAIQEELSTCAKPSLQCGTPDLLPVASSERCSEVIP